MKNHANRRSVGMKTFVAMLALVLVIGCAVGGTVAWLTAQTGPVVNTFTYGDINIELKETTGNDYKIIPGVDIEKDPKVIVKANSEACWLFVEVKKEGTFVTDKVTYSIAKDWTRGNGTDIPENVYYRKVDAVTSDTSFYVLQGNTKYHNGVVTVSKDLTKEDIKGINHPKLTFTAYASQLHKDATTEFTAADAWKNVNPTTNP